MASGVVSFVLPLGLPFLLLLLLHPASSAKLKARMEKEELANMTILPDSCCYGSQKFVHGAVVDSFPGCCLQLVCDDGKISKQYFNSPGDHGCCLFGDQMYPSGEYLPGVCWKMMCKGGEWYYTNEIDDCCAHCLVHNDPHFNTFDNVRYDWHGTCNYSVAQSDFTYDPKLAVYADFRPCGWGAPSCLDRATFKDNPNTVISLHYSSVFDIEVNGVTSTVPDFVVTSIPGHAVLAMRYNGCVVLIGSSRLVVMYCSYRMDVWAHPSHVDCLDGLCGHYNNYRRDDFTDRAGISHPLQYFPYDFPQSWLTDSQTDRECLEPCTGDSCPTGVHPDVSQCVPGPDIFEKYRERCAGAVGTDEHLLDTCCFDLCMIELNGGQDEIIKFWLETLSLNAKMSRMLEASTNGGGVAAAGGK